MTRALFGPHLQDQQDQYICHHRFSFFIAAFPNKTFFFSARISKVDIIDCKTKGSTIAYLFALAIVSKSIMIDNISIFEDLNMNQLDLKKEDPRFGELFTIWWGDLKTEVQMLSMQWLGIGMD